MTKYSFLKLDAAHLEQMKSLQHVIYDQLQPGNKKFIKFKTGEQLQRNVVDPHCGIGCFLPDGQLVGMFCLVRHGGGGDSSVRASCPFVHGFLTAHADKHIGLLCTAMVHPAHRRQGLMSRMLVFLEGEGQARGYDFLLATMATRNGPSEGCFLKHAYSFEADDVDPWDGAEVKFYCKKL